MNILSVCIFGNWVEIGWSFQNKMNSVVYSLSRYFVIFFILCNQTLIYIYLMVKVLSCLNKK